MEEKKETAQKSSDKSNEKVRFEANNVYFTIAVYAIIVIAVGALIIRSVISFEKTMAGIRSVFNVLMPFIIGALLAFILKPAVRRITILLEKWGKIKKRGLRKGLALAITYALFLGFIIVAIFGIVPQLIDSLTDLINLIPASLNYIYDLFDLLEERFPNLDIEALEQAINDTIPSLLNSIKDFVANLVPAIYNISVYIVNWIVNLVIAIIVSIYILTDQKLLKNSLKAIIYAFVPEKRIPTLVEILKECNQLFSSYIIGKAIDSLIIGILCFILMNIFRFPYAMLISVIVGITNMIPYFGPFIGAVPGTLILLMISPLKALGFVALILVLQQFDGLILGPKILGDSTGLRPLWIIIAITVGGSFAGILGMFLGVPVVAVFRYLVNRLLRHRLEKRHYKDIDSLTLE
ncbi:MAG: AI-2E family transporter [Candidatus Limivivens sp.]|nr:AI-2E family transporter [Candidatus Limivivens sp.]